MSDCEVCIRWDVDDSYDEFDSATKIAEVSLKCEECASITPAGASYHWARGSRENETYVHRVCLVCYEIMEAFCCDDIMYGGMFWEQMTDYAFDELTTSCFDKLRTPEAKAELRRRWMEWKGLST